MTVKPLCFIVMPFGVKPDPGGLPDIDFDRLYATALKPAVEAAGMEPIRADHEMTGGVIHKPMFERLVLCDYVLADLTTANANVFYELGVRHTARPSTTLTIFAKHQKIPFDINFLRSLPYDLGANNAFGEAEAEALRQAVGERLQQLRDLALDAPPVDSPLFQLLSGWSSPNLAHLKTDVFREQVQLNESLKRRLAAIREQAKTRQGKAEAAQALARLKEEIGPLDGVDAGTTIDLFLTYRALEDMDGMIAFFDEMPEVLKRQVLVREQLAFAYNRRAAATQQPADRLEALTLLEGVDDQQGPNSETCGLIGRVHKDQWSEALAAGRTIEAQGYLTKSIRAYVRGFLADQRDAYPGINALTLLEIKGDEASLREKEKLFPVVRFAVERRMGETPNYWDHATLLELEVLNNDPAAAAEHLANALAAVRESWEPKTTANNLRMIEQARSGRQLDTAWLLEIISALQS
ncbi:MAG: TRAFs-binding domain-containing protein [Cyanobacteriota bacterium]|nr:TRAFs-binding domain-containing protein [Cyanobacteriota bacterium]